jgi:hypothetical protein
VAVLFKANGLAGDEATAVVPLKELVPDGIVPENVTSFDSPASVLPLNANRVDEPPIAPVLKFAAIVANPAGSWSPLAEKSNRMLRPRSSPNPATAFQRQALKSRRKAENVETLFALTSQSPGTM